MPCSSDHFIPILDELQTRVDQEAGAADQRSSGANKHPGWGGRRPGAGAPKGNLNALKHGLYSRRQAQVLAAIIAVPGVQDALVDIARRNRLRRKQAEEGMGVLFTRLLERTAAMALSEQHGADQMAQDAQEPNDQGDNHDRNNQEFLAFLNDVMAQMRIILEKRSRLRRVTIKPPLNGGPS